MYRTSTILILTRSMPRKQSRGPGLKEEIRSPIPPSLQPPSSFSRSLAGGPSSLCTMSRQLYVCLHNFVDPLIHVQLRWRELRTVILLHLPPPSSDEDITVVDTLMTFPTSSLKSWSTPTSIQIRNLGAAHTKTVAQVAYVVRFGRSTYVWKAKEISFPMDPAL